MHQKLFCIVGIIFISAALSLQGRAAHPAVLSEGIFVAQGESSQWPEVDDELVEEMMKQMIRDEERGKTDTRSSLKEITEGSDGEEEKWQERDKVKRRPGQDKDKWELRKERWEKMEEEAEKAHLERLEWWWETDGDRAREAIEKSGKGFEKWTSKDGESPRDYRLRRILWLEKQWKKYGQIALEKDRERRREGSKRKHKKLEEWWDEHSGEVRGRMETRGKKMRRWVERKKEILERRRKRRFEWLRMRKLWYEEQIRMDNRLEQLEQWWEMYVREVETLFEESGEDFEIWDERENESVGNRSKRRLRWLEDLQRKYLQLQRDRLRQDQ